MSTLSFTKSVPRIFKCKCSFNWSILKVVHFMVKNRQHKIKELELDRLLNIAFALFASILHHVLRQVHAMIGRVSNQLMSLAWLKSPQWGESNFHIKWNMKSIIQCHNFKDFLSSNETWIIQDFKILSRINLCWLNSLCPPCLVGGLFGGRLDGQWPSCRHCEGGLALRPFWTIPLLKSVKKETLLVRIGKEKREREKARS